MSDRLIDKQCVTKYMTAFEIASIDIHSHGVELLALDGTSVVADVETAMRGAKTGDWCIVRRIEKEEYDVEILPPFLFNKRYTLKENLKSIYCPD